MIFFFFAYIFTFSFIACTFTEAMAGGEVDVVGTYEQTRHDSFEVLHGLAYVHR